MCFDLTANIRHICKFVKLGTTGREFEQNSRQIHIITETVIQSQNSRRNSGALENPGRNLLVVSLIGQLPGLAVLCAKVENRRAGHLSYEVISLLPAVSAVVTLG
jgi:hypothetical protein